MKRITDSRRRTKDDRNKKRGGSGYLRSWTRNKSRTEKEKNISDHTDSDDESTEDTESDSTELKTDEDMPPVEFIHEGSNVTEFLSEGVSEELRKLALRKLFHTSKFNIRDGLDDYDDDYRNFDSLGDIITSDMRHEIERLLQADDMSQEQDEKSLSETCTPGNEERDLHGSNADANENT